MSLAGPWSADRALDAEGARRAIREALPELGVSDVRLLGQGWDFDAFEADGHWVFRFPRRAAEQTRLRKEIELLAWLGDTLDLPMPRYAWGALGAPSFPYAFGGYPKLEGVNASTLTPEQVDLERLGRDVGAGFRALHDLEAPAHLVEPLTAALDPVTPRTARDGKARYVELFMQHEDPQLARRAKRWLHDDALLVPDARPTPCVLHDDLHVAHLLLAPDGSQRLVGWLDWGDGALGDPARDFAPLYPWGGDRLLDAMLASYGHPDPAFRERARWYGLCLCFVDWMHWHRTHDAAGRVWTLRVLDAALPPAD